MDRDWCFEECVEVERLIRDKRATCSGRPERTPCRYKCIHRQICRPSPPCKSRVRKDCYGAGRGADQLLLQFIINGRYDREEEGEDTNSAKQVDPTAMPRDSEVPDRPESKTVVMGAGLDLKAKGRRSLRYFCHRESSYSIPGRRKNKFVKKPTN
jgi:hypothetical protein